MFKPMTRNKKVLGALSARFGARHENDLVKQSGIAGRGAQRIIDEATRQLGHLQANKIRKGRKALQDTIREHSFAHQHITQVMAPNMRNRRNRHLKQARALEKSMTPREREIYKREQAREIAWRKDTAQRMRRQVGMKFEVRPHNLGYVDRTALH